MDANQSRTRKSLRLQYYDYATPGAYFVTLCTQDRTCCFGDISEEAMVLNDLGRLAEQEWLSTSEVRPTVELDYFVVMLITSTASLS